MKRLICVIAPVLLLAACAKGPTPPRAADDLRDGPHAVPPDVSNVPDAVPRHEPRSRYGNPKHYEVFGQRYYVLASAENFTERGIASWYGKKFHGRRTSSGESYDMYAMTAAHRQLPLPTYVEVTNLDNGRKVVVRVNDRGPFKKSRIIDLSYAAAAKLGMLGAGTAPVEIRAIQPGRPTQAVTTATDHPGGIAYYIQAGAFADRSNAERLRRRLDASALGVPSLLETIELDGRLLHRVRLGPLSAVADVDRLSDSLTVLGIYGAQVVVDQD